MLIISFTPSSPGPRLIAADPAGFLKGGELQDDVLQEGGHAEDAAPADRPFGRPPASLRDDRVSRGGSRMMIAMGVTNDDP